MCKFTTTTSPGFTKVVSAIKRYAEKAPSTIKQRWEAEGESRGMQKMLKAKELVPGRIFHPSSYHTLETNC